MPFPERRDLILKIIKTYPGYKRVSPEKMEKATMMAVQGYTYSALVNEVHVSKKLADSLIALATSQRERLVKLSEEYPIDASIPWLGHYVEVEL